MRKLWMAVCATVLAAGMATAAGEGDKRPEPPKRPEGNWMKDGIQRNKDMVARWEQALPDVRNAETKKFMTDAIAKGKAMVETMEKVMAAQQAGKEDEARQLMTQSREAQMEFQKYMMLMPTYQEMDRMQIALEDRGKDNPELAGHCQKALELLKKKLELQNQVAAVDAEINKERMAISMSGHGKGPGGDAPKPPPPPPAKDDAAKVIK